MPALLHEIRQVTRHFEDFQGLKALPFGLLLLGYTAGAAGWWTVLQPMRASAVDVLIWVMVGAGYVALARYYRHRFGRVRASDGVRLGGVLGFCVFLLLLSGLGTLQLRYEWPLHTGGLVFAGLFLWAYRQAPLRRHHLVLALLIGALTCLPLLGVPMHTTRTAVWMTMGLALIIGGILDHWLLVRTLGPLPPEEDAADAEVRDGRTL